MLGAGGHRRRWHDLPDAVREAVGDVLGAPVVRADSQPGGFSPGTADRVVTATGGRAFVKAVSPELNPDSVGLHRTEARIAARLPRNLPVPDLVGHVEVAGWVVLVFGDVAGRHPHLPWDRADLSLVLDGLGRLADDATPCPVADLPGAADRLDALLRGADRLAADAVAVPFLSGLQRLSARARRCLDGDTLVHGDLRADNILVTPDRAVLVDWPHACRAGYFLDAARRPPPPGLPTVRALQRVQGEALLAWLTPRLRAW